MVEPCYPFVNPFPYDKFKTSKMKDLAFKHDENGRYFTKKVKNEEIAHNK